MSDVPTASAEQLILDRLREYQRAVEALSRIGPQGLTAQQLMQHVTAQVSRATMIARTKVLRYRPEKGDPTNSGGLYGIKVTSVSRQLSPARAFSPIAKSLND